MRRIVFLLFTISFSAYGDTIDRYMNIVNNIPQMEMKADQQSQAWARSARTILVLTSESIAETLALANENAMRLGSPLFCLPPPGNQLNAIMLHELIQETYRGIPSQQSDKDKMTVSQVALLGMTQKYPCTQKITSANQMAHGIAWK